MVPERRDSWMFHHPAVEWTGLQSNALGFPLVTAKTSGVKEEELTALRQSLSELVASLGIECVITGGIASEYQRSRIDRICDELGIQAIAPLWGKSPRRLLREEIEMRFEFVLTACMAMGLNQSWLGRVIDMDALKELENISQRHGINVAFEGGEAETFVTDAPIFSKRIRIVEAEPIWKGDSGYLRIVRAEFDQESKKSV
jgi:ABC transporter with metal-binding/Fe-S-binding domain ATP-binding protein